VKLGTSMPFIKVHLTLDKECKAKKADIFPAKCGHAFSHRQRDIVVSGVC
jgi:hypothetical protein